MSEFNEVIPLSLYIHLPWCIKKCPYCDFNSHELPASRLDEGRYINALVRDLESELPRIQGRQIISIFIGGGTPSLFSAEALDKLLSKIRVRLNFHPQIEITLEANPGASDAERFLGYRQIGINRISLGVQSFNDEKLMALGRIHSSEEASHAIAMIKQAGFENFNIDLMYGLSEQTLEEALNDLAIAVEHSPTHISWYQLTIEPNTVFYTKPPELPNDDLTWDTQQAGQRLLSKAAYSQYEISAYARVKKQCVHNMNYWQFGDYLGIGAGAHGKISNVAENKVERFSRNRIPKRYTELVGTDSAITEQRELTPDDLVLEFMMNALRLNQGFSGKLFQDRAGMALSILKKALASAEEQGLIEWELNSIRPTGQGRRYLNDLLQLFVK